MSDRTAALRWVVAGGGTGGHVTPALALAETIAARGDSVRIFGSERGLETRLVPDAGFELVALPGRQVMGQSLGARLRAVVDLARGCVAAWRALGAGSADVVVSVGGYASVPAVAAAAVRRLPIALVEPNAVPGRANRAAARVAALIFVQFDEAAAALGGSQRASGLRTLGIPLRQSLVEAFAKGPPRRVPEAPFRLLVAGGSQGAKQINEAMIEAAKILDPARLEVFHQTGEADRERVAEAYRSAGFRAEVVAFERDMPSRYHWADLAVCRAGALTVAELAMAALPSLLVPYPYAADDHQSANARSLARAGAARVLDAKSLTGADLARELADLLADPAEIEAMSAAAGVLARPDAASDIVAECAALAAARGRR
jgi:UDP-N-acetylglucosamine--N-acetylmuramyl-(pentapeptide) pyrophosphoryl-undecaprenol N-acetylglucosamine transferase